MGGNKSTKHSHVLDLARVAAKTAWFVAFQGTWAAGRGTRREGDRPMAHPGTTLVPKLDQSILDPTTLSTERSQNTVHQTGNTEHTPTPTLYQHNRHTQTQAAFVSAHQHNVVLDNTKRSEAAQKGQCSWLGTETDPRST